MAILRAGKGDIPDWSGGIRCSARVGADALVGLMEWGVIECVGGIRGVIFSFALALESRRCYDRFRDMRPGVVSGMSAVLGITFC